MDLIKRTIAKGATDLELELFVRQCERTGLDPFARQIYAIKRWDASVGAEVMQTQVSIDGLRTLAADTNEMGGQDGPFWCGLDGYWLDVWLEPEPPKAARVIVIRSANGTQARFTGTALWSSYAQTKRDGSLNRMWAQMGAEMLAKCAEALALRKAFPQRLSGLYTSDEMGQADGHAPVRVEPPERPLEPPEKPADPLPAVLAHPTDPEPSEANLGGNPGTLGAESSERVQNRMRQRVSEEMGRLTAAQRSSALALGDAKHLRLPDEQSFTSEDANGWLIIFAKVRSDAS